MIEKIKNIIEILESLQQYPFWLKCCVAFWVAYSVALICAALVYYPKKEPLRIVQITRIQSIHDDIRLQIRVANSTDAEIQLIALELRFYEEDVLATDGALQTTEEITGYYNVIDESTNGTIGAKLNQETGILPVAITYPFANRKDYAILSMNLAQTVPKNGGDRFQIAIQSAKFPPHEAKFIKAIVHYDDDKETLPKIIALK